MGKKHKLKIVKKEIVNLENFTTWYGSIDLGKLGAYIDNNLLSIYKYKIYNMSLKHKCYLFMQNYQELLKKLGDKKELRQNIILKDNKIINTYNDKVYYKIYSEKNIVGNYIIEKQCRTKKMLDNIIKKYYPKYILIEKIK